MMFKERLISGIVVAVVTIGLTIAGGVYLLALLLVAALIGMYE